MKISTTPYIIMALALVLAFAALFGDESYRNLSVLRTDLTKQKTDNQQLGTEVEQLKTEVWNLKNNPRYIEKVARNRYALARPDEKVFIFRD